jgi:hypothetical protein
MMTVVNNLCCVAGVTRTCGCQQPAPVLCAAANDPNGPLASQGRHQIVYQHQCRGAGACAWQQHPPALCTTLGAPEGDGCFSGCDAVVPRHSVQQFAGQSLQRSGSGDAHTGSQQQEGLQGTANSASSSGGRQEADSTCVPVLLYPGVGPCPDAPAGLCPSSMAASELCYEQQLAAVTADPGKQGGNVQL